MHGWLSGLIGQFLLCVWWIQSKDREKFLFRAMPCMARNK